MQKKRVTGSTKGYQSAYDRMLLEVERQKTKKKEKEEEEEEV